MTAILSGQIIATFAFDVGYEITLERISNLIKSAPLKPLTHKKKSPPYLQYANPPQFLTLGTTDMLPGYVGQITATVFDFGVVSIAYRWSIPAQTVPIPIESLPEISKQLYELNLEADAREKLKQLAKTIEPAITRLEISELVEDYYLFIVEEFDAGVSAEQLLLKHGATLAQTLSFDVQPLSKALLQEVSSQAISYYENDLVLVGWNASFIYDRDYWDTMNVLEFLNVELLEARYVDAQLDKRLSEYGNSTRTSVAWPIPLRNPYKRVVDDLAELRLESSLVSERVDNALKLIGDIYLASIHTAASKRFYMPEWEGIISRKLDIVDHFYQLTTDRVQAAQAQTLEIIIILLILLEIVLALFVQGH